MKKFLCMLLAVLFCTSAMCTDDVYAGIFTSNSASKTEESVQNSIQNAKPVVVNNVNKAYSDEEVYLAAQLIHHEAHNQTYNGKVAVAEVLLNRVKSGLFPNSINDVVCQNGQFSNSRRIKNISPSELEIRIASDVLNGNLRVFNDSEVLYFRNPKITSGLSAKVDKNWGNLDYVTYIGDHAFYSQTEVGKKDTLASNGTSNNVKSNEATQASGKTSLFDKFHVTSGFSGFMFGNKTSVAKIEENVKQNIPVEIVVTNDTLSQGVNTDEAEAVVPDGIINPDAAVAAAHTALFAAKTAGDKEDELVATQIVALATANATDNQNELSSEETVDVDSAVIMASAQALALKIVQGSKDSDDAVMASLEEEFDLDEEYDENDPVAVARHNAMLERKAEVERRAKEIELQNKANEAAQEQASIDEQVAVDIVSRQNEEMARATQAAVEFAIANQK